MTYHRDFFPLIALTIQSISKMFLSKIRANQVKVQRAPLREFVQRLFVEVYKTCKLKYRATQKLTGSTV